HTASPIIPPPSSITHHPSSISHQSSSISHQSSSISHQSSAISNHPSPISTRAAKIKLVLTDVDGVLTDAGMYYSETGDELKKFNTRDGMGFQLLREAGILTGIVTSEDTAIVARRAKKLKVDFLYQGVKDKAAVLDEILDRTGLTADQVAYMGDDINDLGILSRAGLAACPRDAVAEIVQKVDFQASSRGGMGCFRELVARIVMER
ncbi:MAG: HAD-IIIA family hydrolase, partial [Opitutales bacterium]|nr:HAD-IIIA family hydrolase [Opitutales bacterium]